MTLLLQGFEPLRKDTGYYEIEIAFISGCIQPLRTDFSGMCLMSLNVYFTANQTSLVLILETTVVPRTLAWHLDFDVCFGNKEMILFAPLKAFHFLFPLLFPLVHILPCNARSAENHSGDDLVNYTQQLFCCSLFLIVRCFFCNRCVNLGVCVCVCLC